MKNKILFLLLFVIVINAINAQSLIPNVRKLSELNDPNTVQFAIACADVNQNKYHENAFYRFFDLEDYVTDGTIESGSFMVTRLEFGQASATDNIMLTYFVGTIQRSDYYTSGGTDSNTQIDLNKLSILQSGNYVAKSSDNGTLVRIPIEPLTLNTDQILYYAILVSSGDFDTHHFELGLNTFGERSSPYFNTSGGGCDVSELTDFDTETIAQVKDNGGFIMNMIGITNPSTIGPPPNDVCESAQDLTVGTSLGEHKIDMTTLNATQEGGGCNTGNAIPMSNEVWAKVVIPTEGHVVVETGPDEDTGSTGFVSGMDAWSGSCGTLTNIGCDSSNFSNDGFSSIVINGTPGETVFVRVFGNFVVPFSVSAYNPPEPANMVCEDAQPMNIGATFEDQDIESSFLWGNGDNGGLWYSFVAPSDGNITLETGPDSRGIVAANTIIEAFSGTCENFNLTPLGTNLNGGESDFSKLDLTGLTPGETYFFVVNDWFQTYRASFSVSVYNPTTLSVSDDTFNDFSYFPNPTKDMITFESLKKIKQVKVFSPLGQQVPYIENKKNGVIESVDISSLPNGMYLMRVSANNQTKVVKIIKE